jgi:hypothetical protein
VRPMEPDPRPPTGTPAHGPSSIEAPPRSISPPTSGQPAPRGWRHAARGMSKRSPLPRVAVADWSSASAITCRRR